VTPVERRDVSVVILGGESGAREIKATLDSVLTQTRLAADSIVVLGTKRGRDVATEVWGRRVTPAHRVEVLEVGEPTSLSTSIRESLSAIRGQLVWFLEAGDVLEPDALEVISTCIGSADIAYADEFIMDPGGARYVLMAKPAWSPEHLRSQMYTGRAAIFSAPLLRELVETIDLDHGAPLYDLMLRASEMTSRIAKVPMPLLSVYRDPSRQLLEGPMDAPSRVRIVSSHSERVGASVEVSSFSNRLSQVVSQKWEGREPLVSIVIPTGGTALTVHGSKSVAATRCLQSITQLSEWTNIEVVLVVDEGTKKSVRQGMAAAAPMRSKVVSHQGEFNFSRKVNQGVLEAAGDYLIVLNDDTEVISKGWIREMVGLLRSPDVGLVGAKLLYPDGTIQHGGQFWHHDPGHLLCGLPGDEAGFMNAADVVRECAGVTAACIAVRRDTFLEVGGFTENLPGSFNDVDFCLKVQATGKRIIWTPHACLWHFESASRDPRVLPEETAFLRDRWAQQLANDPYVSLGMLDPIARAHFKRGLTPERYARAPAAASGATQVWSQADLAAF
jgi:GT2 family glycosyltransferase